MNLVTRFLHKFISASKLKDLCEGHDRFFLSYWCLIYSLTKVPSHDLHTIQNKWKQFIQWFNDMKTIIILNKQFYTMCIPVSLENLCKCKTVRITDKRLQSEIFLGSSIFFTDMDFMKIIWHVRIFFFWTWIYFQG